MANSESALLARPILSESGTHAVQTHPTAPPSTTIDVFDAAGEQRWQQWVASGVSRDRETMARARVVMLLGAGLLLAALAIFYTLSS
jgi:hypothetical protein